MASSNPKLKRQRQRHDSDSENEDSGWPRFLVIEGTDDNKPLSKLSPFAIQKGIKGLAGEPKGVRRLRSGNLLIEVDRASHASNLLRSTAIADIPIKVSKHRTLNTKKGVIRCRDIRDCTDDEILQNLASQQVTEIHRIKITRDGVKVSTGTFILTFNATVLPAAVKVAFMNVPVEAFVPNPMRCFNCQKFGHTKNFCKRKLVCARCSCEDHDDKTCDKPARCVNCGGNHSAFAKTCPNWLKEKNIQKIKQEKNIPYPEARMIAERQNAVSVSYAGAVRGTPRPQVHSATVQPSPHVGSSAVRPGVQLCTVQVQTDLTWPEDTEQPQLITSDRPEMVAPITKHGASSQTEQSLNQITQKDKIKNLIANSIISMPKPSEAMDAEQASVGSASTQNHKDGTKPKHKNTPSSSTVNQKGGGRPKEPPHPSRNSNFNREQKGSNPIATYNRYGDLDDMDAEEASMSSSLPDGRGGGDRSLDLPPPLQSGNKPPSPIHYNK